MGPPFSRVVCFLLMLVSPYLLAGPCASSNSNAGSEFKMKSTTFSLGSGLGASGLHTFDSNGNGLNEMIFGTGSGFAANTRFSIAEFNPNTAEFNIICQSERYSETINVIAAFTNNSIESGSLVAYGNQFIEVIDHKVGFKAQLISTSLGSIKDIVVGDIDNDGADEIAVLSQNKIAIYDANNYSFEQYLPYGGSEFALGHFASKSKIQIATSSGYVIELNDKTSSVVWNNSASGFSTHHLEAGDVDDDGFDEIVAADGWYNLRVFNADLQGYLWEHSADLDVDAVAVYDVTGDGIPEVIYGDGQWGNVYALNGNDGTQLWSVKNPEHGTTDVFIGNVDDDTGLELVWGAGHSSTGPDYLYVHEHRF